MTEVKPVLAIETSGSLCGAAVYYSDYKFFEVSIQNKNVHAEKIFEAVDFVLKSAGVEPSDLSSVAVSSGPGSFTGLRIGMSAAKGIAFGASLPIVSVPTFDAIALQLCGILPENTTFALANKVNVEELYFAKFQINANSFIFVEALEVIHKNELKDRTGDCIVFGNAVEDNNYSVPKPEFVAKWSLINKDKMTYDFDYLEPDYLKNFIIHAPAKAGL